ncbi:MAG: transposase [FCB group bacterium]|nr:transposase [FCB group bacterium]MBL7028852.1 transposase [Candidatus Neomarinimicrobiota bacterium]MBL7121693.1 transposase [Candidatus Neomarinimicrobiota bacterium]
MRLKGYDYTKPGKYYVTIVTKKHKHLFGHIEKGSMQLNESGLIVKQSWEWLENQYDYVDLDEFIVMPDHLHGIMILRKDRGVSRNTSAEIATKRKSLGRLIGAFKTVSTKQLNQIHKTPGVKLWQRDFHDQVIRGSEDLDRIRRYIIDNPKKWNSDA